MSEVVAKRIENDIVLQFKVPTANTDESTPADLRKIEVYAHTGPLPAPADFVKYGTLVASVDVKQPPTPEEQRAQEAAATATPDDTPGATGDASEVPPAQQAASSDPRLASPAGASRDRSRDDREASLLEQGSTTTVRETLTPKHMEIGPMPPARPVPPPTDKPVVIERLETSGTLNFDLSPQRYYTVVGVSESRNRRGPFAGPFQVALVSPSTPPEKVDVAYTADAISLSWPSQPEDVAIPAPVTPAGKGSPAQASPAGPAPPATPAQPASAPVDRETEGTYELYADVETEGTRDVLAAFTPPAGAKTKPTPPLPAPPPPKARFGYNVYESGAPAPAPAPAPAVPAAPVAPLNTALLTTPEFADPRVEFGIERCYIVRRVEMVGTVAIESAPSSPTCVTPVDTFPPSPPKSLAHIAGGNGVSLLWEANTEPDLAGYLVLRGEAPGDTLSPLTPTPITDTSYLDTTTRRGRTYFYEVVAVDRSTPPNQSAPSERVEETIR